MKNVAIETKLENAIEVLAGKACLLNTTSDESLRFTQAALNAANTLVRLRELPKG